MTPEDQQIVAEIVSELENAWNAADGDAFARPFAEDADFVNIRGEHHRTRGAIAKGHHAILSTIYKGSVVRFQVAAVRAIAPGVILDAREERPQRAHRAARRRTPRALLDGHRAERRRLVNRVVPQHAGELEGRKDPTESECRPNTMLCFCLMPCACAFCF